MSVPTELRSLDKRKARSYSLRRLYPDRVPVIISPPAQTKREVSKYLVPFDTTVASMLNILRTRLTLSATEAIYLCTTGGTMLAGSQSIGEIYNRDKAEDGFLYLKYCYENVFG